MAYGLWIVGWFFSFEMWMNSPLFGWSVFRLWFGGNS